MSIHESNNHVWIPMFGLALALLGPVDAGAQSPAAGPDEAACQGKQSGEACSLVNGSAGSCGPGTCSRLDYSQGSPPRASEEPCTVCVVASVSTDHHPPPLGTTTDTSEGAATSEEPRSSGDAKSAEADAPPESSSRCNVTDRSHPSDLGWLGLLGACAVGLAGRRRKRKLR